MKRTAQLRIGRYSQTLILIPSALGTRFLSPDPALLSVHVVAFLDADQPTLNGLNSFPENCQKKLNENSLNSAHIGQCIAQIMIMLSMIQTTSWCNFNHDQRPNKFKMADGCGKEASAQKNKNWGYYKAKCLV